MPGRRIYWIPPTDTDVAEYQINTGNPPQLLATVLHSSTSPNFQAASNRYFYDDPSGTATTQYQVLSISTSGVVISDSGLFTPVGPLGGATPERIKVDTDYGGVNALQFVTESGMGIPDADIRIYTQAEYEAGNRNTPLYVVKTLADGRWDRPVYLQPGLTYVLLCVKERAYESNPTTILV